MKAEEGEENKRKVSKPKNLSFKEAKKSRKEKKEKTHFCFFLFEQNQRKKTKKDGENKNDAVYQCCI